MSLHTIYELKVFLPSQHPDYSFVLCVLECVLFLACTIKCVWSGSNCQVHCSYFTFVRATLSLFRTKKSAGFTQLDKMSHTWGIVIFLRKMVENIVFSGRNCTKNLTSFLKFQVGNKAVVTKACLFFQTTKQPSLPCKKCKIYYVIWHIFSWLT
jgi:hypothetical protein